MWSCHRAIGCTSSESPSLDLLLHFFSEEEAKSERSQGELGSRARTKALVRGLLAMWKWPQSIGFKVKRLDTGGQWEVPTESVQTGIKGTLGTESCRWSTLKSLT